MKKANLSHFDHVAGYQPSVSKHSPFRSTQIIATITRDMQKEEIVGMIKSGMNIARFTAAEDVKEDKKNIDASLRIFREAVKDYNEKRRKDSEKQQIEGVDCKDVHVAAALDLKGSSLETGRFKSNLKLQNDDTIALTTENNREKVQQDCIFVNIPQLPSLSPGQEIIVKETIKLRVQKVESDEFVLLQCRVMRAGDIKEGEKVEVNIPGVQIPDTKGSDAVMAVIDVCKELGIDMLFVPITDPQQFNIIRCAVNGGQYPLKIIAKLEGEAAVRRVDEIIVKADGIVLSRGRLGRNIPPEQVIVYQKNIIAKCLKAGIPSIVASDMLKSMETNGSDATRAEIADVFNAVLDGSDCTMLDDSVSNCGCIETMRNTIMEAEDMTNYRRYYLDLLTQLSIPPSPISSLDFTNVTAVAACTAAMVNGANAIVVLTSTGKTVRMISKYRPECPIIAVCRSAVVARQCLLFRGVLTLDLGGKLITENIGQSWN